MQQRQGRVYPKSQCNNVALNDDPVLEHEADHMGREALQMKTDSLKTLPKGRSHGIIQREPVPNSADGVHTLSISDWRIGPSCWLFVLDAMFRELGAPPFDIRAGKFFYPQSEDIPAVGDKRVSALTVLITRIENLIAAIAQITEWGGGTDITRKVFERKARQVVYAEVVDANGSAIFGANDIMTKAAITTALSVAKTSMTDIRTRIQTHPPKQTDIEAIMGTEKIDTGQNIGNVAYLKKYFLSLDSSFPMYMAVNTRFSPREEHYAFDFTDGQPHDSMKKRGAHAILLVGMNYGTKIGEYKKGVYDKWTYESYDKWGNLDIHNDIWQLDDSTLDDGFVTYKDPNYGNQEINIKWSQFIMMSQGDVLFSIVPVQ